MVEVVGENEQLDYFAEQLWKGQVQRATRSVRNSASRRLVQSAFSLQALGMKDCVEQDKLQLEPGDQRHQFLFTICVLLTLVCMNWLYVHWHDIERWLRTRSRKRPIQQTENEISDVETREPVRVRPGFHLLCRNRRQEQVRRMIQVRIQSLMRFCRRPRFPPPPSTLQPRWAPWSPEWFLYWMAGRVTKAGTRADDRREAAQI